MPYIGTTPTKVVSRQSANVYRYTATAGQSVFTGADLDNNVLACNPADMIVHMNGLRLESTDYTATSTSVTLTTAATAGDEVTVTSFVTFEVADTYTKTAADSRYVNTTGDTMTGNLTVTNATPAYQLQATGGNVYQVKTDLNDLYIRSATAGLDAVKVDFGGRVTMPYQPAFLCRPQSNYAITAGEFTVDGTWTADYNVGNHFNTSGGTFTAPVGGVYVFNWAVFASGSLGSRSDAWVSVNGVVRLRTEINSYNGGTTNRNQHVHGQLKLSTNDVVRFGTYQNNNCFVYSTTSPWSYASGVLIG